jgi:hypothetical protein
VVLGLAGLLLVACHDGWAQGGCGGRSDIEPSVWTDYDAGAPSSGPPSTRWPLDQTRVTIRNASSQSVWLGATPFTVPTPSLSEPAVAEIVAELGCVCDCNSLPDFQSCSAEQCVVMNMAAAAVEPLEPGAQRELLWVRGDRTLRRFGQCAYDLGVEPGTEIDARTCWFDRDPLIGSKQLRCLDTPFFYGAPTLEVIIPGDGSTEPDEDASVGDEHAGRDADGGA